MDACSRMYPGDPQRSVLEKQKNKAMAEKNRAEAAAQVNELLKKKFVTAATVSISWSRCYVQYKIREL